MTAGLTAESRRLDIDQLRNAIVLSLIVFHTARLFKRQPRHIKDAQTYREADITVAPLDVPSMPLSFRARRSKCVLRASPARCGPVPFGTGPASIRAARLWHSRAGDAPGL